MVAQTIGANVNLATVSSQEIQDVIDYLCEKFGDGGDCYIGGQDIDMNNMVQNEEA